MNKPETKDNTVEVAKIIGITSAFLGSVIGFCYCFTLYNDTKNNRLTDLQIFNAVSLYSQPA